MLQFKHTLDKSCIGQYQGHGMCDNHWSGQVPGRVLLQDQGKYVYIEITN